MRDISYAQTIKAPDTQLECRGFSLEDTMAHKAMLDEVVRADFARMYINDDVIVFDYRDGSYLVQLPYGFLVSVGE